MKRVFLRTVSYLTLNVMHRSLRRLGKPGGLYVPELEAVAAQTRAMIRRQFAGVTNVKKVMRSPEVKQLIDAATCKVA